MMAVQTWFGIQGRIALEPRLEEGPGHVHHDAGVASAKPVGQRDRVAQPVQSARRARRRRAPRNRPAPSVNGSLSGQSRKAGRVRIAAMCTACPGLVQQLVEIVQPAGLVGREDPRLGRRPASADPPGTGAEIGGRDRGLAFARREVVVHVEGRGVGAKRAEHRAR